VQINPIRRYSTPVQNEPTSDAPSAADIPTFGPPSAPSAELIAVKMRTYKPRTPGLRHLRRPINDHLWKGRPYLPLTFPKKGQSKGGRNHSGRITVRHRGGGAKRRIRTVDFFRWTPGPHTVERIEYDPGRSAHIALVTENATGKKSYILAAEGMRAGDVVQSYRAGIPQDLLDSMGGVLDPGIIAAKTCWRGNCLPLHLIPVGTVVFNVGSRADGPGIFCRSAGTYAIIVSKEEETRADGTKVMTGKHVIVRLQSGEVRKVSKDACATIGVASNIMHQFRQLGKAGRSRLLNIRPTVRGVAMNASMWAGTDPSLFSTSLFPSLLFLRRSPWSTARSLTTVTQMTIPTVVVVVNPRVTGTLSVHGASPPRVASRRARSTTPTSGWWCRGNVTLASGGTRIRRRRDEQGTCVSCCTICKPVPHTQIGNQRNIYDTRIETAVHDISTSRFISTELVPSWERVLSEFNDLTPTPIQQFTEV
jgi:ribosomal protein L2